jgi:NADH-quinone oxidoreductase subunit H
MNQDSFVVTVNIIKMAVIFLLMIQLVPILVWVERRGSAFIQNRLGPNRVGPLGLMQLLADAVKFAFKEEFAPEKGYKSFFYMAPVLALLPGVLAFGSIPLSVPFTLNGDGWSHTFATQVFDLGIGIVFVLGVSSLAAYALLLAGWGSANKFSLFGALRASAQMISYELALGLSLVGILLCYGTFDFSQMIEAQQGPLTFFFLGKEYAFLSFLPAWGIFYQPLGALLFFVSVFAETNRLPFDLPEAEAELVAGYHTEYGGLKMLMFYIGEYGHMMVASALLATFYFGGYTMPGLTVEGVRPFLGQTVGVESFNAISLLTMLIFHLVLLIKILIFLWIFIWVRWTLPRFRYDQLMDLGWKKMLPWAIFNTIITAVFILLARGI